MTKVKMIKNAVERMVPTVVNGVMQTPFQGVGKYKPQGCKTAPLIKSCSDYPADGNKIVKSLKEALQKCGLKDGITISSHHHFRNGDLIMNQVFDIAAKQKIKGLRWFPSAAFPCHKPVIDHMKNGVVDWVEGSLNGPIGDYASHGNMNGTAVLRSHGGRWQAVQDGEVHIDIAIIAAPTTDAFGNATGDRGPSACGLLGFGLVDSIYADKVIIVTDNRFAVAVRRTAVNSYVFAESVVVTDNQLCLWFDRSDNLRFFAEDAVGKQAVVISEGNAGANDNVGFEDTAGADNGVGADDTTGPDENLVGQFGGFVNHGSRCYLGH